MEFINKILESFPNARCLTVKSGDSEIDMTCPHHKIWVGGPNNVACFECDLITDELNEKGLIVKRIGPREIHVSKTVQILNFSDETASF